MEKITQELVREMLSDYIEKFGVKKSFIAKKIGCSRSMMTKFISGTDDFGYMKLNSLYNYIKNGGNVND